MFCWKNQSIQQETKTRTYFNDTFHVLINLFYGCKNMDLLENIKYKTLQVDRWSVNI